MHFAPPQYPPGPAMPMPTPEGSSMYPGMPGQMPTAMPPPMPSGKLKCI